VRVCDYRIEPQRTTSDSSDPHDHIVPHRIVSDLEIARFVGRLGSRPRLVGLIGLGVRVISASFEKNVRLVGRIGSEVQVSASFQKMPVSWIG